MADILLKRDSSLAATYIPNTFIDEYMTHADGEFVKIYLYLLRCMGNPDTMFSISDIADKFDHTEKDVTRALRYWEKMRLLRLEFNQNDELASICLSDFALCNAGPANHAQAPHAAGMPNHAQASHATGIPNHAQASHATGMPNHAHTAHTADMPGHSHTAATPNHAQASHAAGMPNHAQASHTADMPGHSHTAATPNHAQASHTIDMPGHSHTAATPNHAQASHIADMPDHAQALYAADMPSHAQALYTADIPNHAQILYTAGAADSANQPQAAVIALGTPAAKTADTHAIAHKHQLPERTEYSRNQLVQFQADEAVAELLFVAERYLGHPLNHPETQMILYWLDKLEFSQDMIEYLIEQCVAKNHRSVRYMDKIALAWAEAGIRTLTDAKQSSEVHSYAARAVQKAFGISNRALADPELEYVQKWSKEMGFSDEIIALACEKTIQRIHQINFEYTNTILKSWKLQNAQTLNDIKLLDAQYQETKAKKISVGKTAVRTAKGAMAGGFANFTQRTYNYDELERELLSHAR